jgi:hypothetical protein
MKCLVSQFLISYLVISYKEVDVVGSLTALEVLEGIMGSTSKLFQIIAYAVQG